MSEKNLSIDWEKMSGLVPTIVQDQNTSEVLMLGYMNKESLEKTLETGLVTFYSRSQEKLWPKAETSGNTLTLVSIDQDCDNDSLLIKAHPKGPTCHKGTISCFDSAPAPELGFLGSLSALVASRAEKLPEGSYTTKLFEAGIHRMAQKVGEEGVEVALAAKDDDQKEFLGEAADLIFHLMVLLQGKGSSLAEVVKILQSRHSN